MKNLPEEFIGDLGNTTYEDELAEEEMELQYCLNANTNAMECFEVEITLSIFV
jgi:hypothetical protein